MSMNFIDISCVEGTRTLKFRCFSVQYSSVFITFALQIFPVRLNKCLVCSRRQQGVILSRLLFMPKVKTNSSAKKRFKVTGSGEITFQKAFKRHILTKKSKKRKRALNKKGVVGAPNKDFVLRLLRLKG